MSETHVMSQRTNWSNTWRTTSTSANDCIISLHNLQNGATSAVTVEHKVTTALPCVVQQLCCQVEPCGL